jgi:3',5'-cyclic AMP phosphodiesterase CpdA
VADSVIALIDSIGTVTLDSKTAIEAARTAYDALTDEQKVLVANYEILTAAEASLKAVQDAADKAAADKAAADAVTEKIAAIGTVTKDSKAAIEATRAAYDTLSDEQKALVTNYETLTAAEASLKALQDAADKAAADKAAAAPVIEQINAIGTVTLDSKTAVEAARAAYNALTADQKALVANYETLTAAEKALANLNKPADPDNPQTGDNTPIVLFTIMMVASAACLAVLTLYKKKFEE